MFTRIVWFYTQIVVNRVIFDKYACEYGTHECDKDTRECDLYTQSAVPYAKCDFYTQSVICTRIVI
jgi:hypothetical protein